MNYKILQIKHDINKLETYFDPESRLNCKILDKKPINIGTIVIIGLLPENNTKGEYIGYDTMICRDNHVPKSEDWGTWAWSWLNYQSAKKQFDNIALSVEKGDAS